MIINFYKDVERGEQCYIAYEDHDPTNRRLSNLIPFFNREDYREHWRQIIMKEMD